LQGLAIVIVATGYPESKMLISDGKPILLKSGVYKLTTNWSWQDAKLNTYIVPKGFQTDLASIPFPFDIYWPKDFSRSYSKAAILHDYIFVNHGAWVNQQFINISYHQAHNIFRDCMVDLGEHKLNYLPIYHAVLFFSWLFWFTNKNPQ
jgi:hypothetical protein